MTALSNALKTLSDTSDRRPGIACERMPRKPAWTELELARFFLIAAEFGLVVLIIGLFQLETLGFRNLVILAWCGFLVHHFLPARWRLPFFVALSLAGLPLVVGWKAALAVVASGYLLIGICHLPIRWAARVGLMLLVGGLLALIRAGWFLDNAQRALAILGSLFMFRLIIYMYDLRHRAAPCSFFRASAFFFMLPNVCFPMYPVVDYKTFCATYFNTERLRIYQSGLRWMVRGIVHLLLYRLIYQRALIDPMEVTDLGGVAWFMVATFMLYLKVSGQFHMIIGLLHLFGFNLPETHHLYLFSSSFADLWRRINIYWKDFIMKIFFYPAYFRLKRFGPTAGLVLATLFAFIATWAGHSYQWFWLRGAVLFTWQDMTFWAILTVLVIINVLREAKGNRRRVLASRPSTLANLVRGASTVATFVTLCMLWTLWGCQSMEELRWLASAAQHTTVMQVSVILCGLLGLGVAAVVWGRSSAVRTEAESAVKAPTDARAFRRAASEVGFACVALLLLAALPHWSGVAETGAGDLLAAMQADNMNKMDLDALRRGYYEDLDVPRREVELERLRSLKPADWDKNRELLFRPTNDFQFEEPIPSAHVFYKGTWITHNRWSLRGPECTKAKPPGNLRIALLGSSHEYGLGVADDQVYGQVLAAMLNREAGKQGPAYEVLNFALPGHICIHLLQTLEHKALEFNPDVVLVAVNHLEFLRAEGYFATHFHAGDAMPYEWLRTMFERAQAERTMPSAQIRTRIHPFIHEMVTRSLERMAAICHERGIPLYVIYRPDPFHWRGLVDGRNELREKQSLQDMVQALSLPFLDLSPAFDSYKNRHELIIAPFDEHTNARGNRLLAEELFRQLHDRPGHCFLQARVAQVPAAVPQRNVAR